MTGGPDLAISTCARRLALLGVEEPPAVECRISWHGPARIDPARPGTEATVQALSGLMEVHGRDAARPRRIGLEIASVAAGVLAALGVLSARIAKRRGRHVEPVETSVLQGGLMMMSHYVAAATAGGEQVPTAPGPEPGPPFRTADDRWFEIEVFDAEGWKRFWGLLGAEGADLGRAWTSFRGRYYRGDCTFPPGLHATTTRHTLAEVAAVAEGAGVSLCEIRDYDAVRAVPGWSSGAPELIERSGVRKGAETEPFRAPEPGGDGLPLAGLRVVEATNRMQGPLAGLLLRMLGAEVIKVEPPGGEPGRLVPPYAGDTGSFFLCFNRGKRSVEIDVSGESGRAELLDLLTGADVFLHNWRPGRAAAWGLDASDLAGSLPSLVHATASGWGDAGLDRRLIGTDFLVQAYAGAGYGVEPAGVPPRPSRVLLTDFMGALVTCEAILAALHRREESGVGVATRTSLLQGAMALQAHVFEGMTSGHEHGRDRGRPVWGPLDVPVETAEGFLVVAPPDDAAFRTVCEAVGVDPVHAARGTVEEEVAARLAAEPAPAWEKLLAEAGVPCAVARTDLVDLAADPGFAGLFEPLAPRSEGPLAGSSVAPASPWAVLA